MKVRRQVDTARRVVRLQFELPLDMDPDRAADKAWELTERQMRAVQAREAHTVGTVPTGLTG